MNSETSVSKIGLDWTVTLAILCMSRITSLSPALFQSSQPFFALLIVFMVNLNKSLGFEGGVMKKLECVVAFFGISIGRSGLKKINLSPWGCVKKKVQRRVQ